MKNNKIFTDAINTLPLRNGAINRQFISKIILKDKTNTIRKYLNSYGIMQLALFLKELYLTHHPIGQVMININEYTDTHQQKVQRKDKGKSIAQLVGKLEGVTLTVNSTWATTYTGTLKASNGDTVFLSNGENS